MKSLEESYVCFSEIVPVKARLVASHLRLNSTGRRSLFNRGQYGILYDTETSTCYLLHLSSMISISERGRHKLVISLIENFLKVNPNGQFPKNAKIL